MRTDQCGYQVTGAGPVGVERLDTAVRSLLLFADNVGDAWESTVADDPAFALGHIGRAYLRCLSSEAPDAAEARTILGNVGDGHELSDRERRDLGGASARLRASRDQAVEPLQPPSARPRTPTRCTPHARRSGGRLTTPDHTKENSPWPTRQSSA